MLAGVRGPYHGTDFRVNVLMSIIAPLASILDATKKGGDALHIIYYPLRIPIRRDPIYRMRSLAN